jgi:DNA-directed RNA polymerase specialized sigma24 family protein
MMSGDSQTENQPSDQHRWFTTTHWSVVLSAREGSPDSEKALQALCLAYWQPLHAYIRRCGNGEHDAQDLTQEFIAQLLAKDFLANVFPHKGKFRSFLLASLKNFLASEHHRSTALKRGGGMKLVPIDADPEEEFLRVEPATHETPESIFERRWAVALMERAFAKLRDEFAAASKAVQFDRLKEYLQADAGRGDYNAAAHELKMSPSAVGVAVHRLRQRFGELIRREIADTVASTEEIDDEMRHLASVLGEGHAESL